MWGVLSILSYLKESYYMKPSFDKLYKDLKRKEYIEAMKDTRYGWVRSEKFPHVGCPSDLAFVSEADQPFGDECHTGCRRCWEYVLQNKWK